MKGRKGSTDLDRLQGQWDIASLEVDGQSLPQPVVGGARIEVTGDRFRSLNMGAEYEGTLTIDPSVTPKTFDLTFTKGPEAGHINRAIYEIDGDLWKLCLATRGDSRPSEFATAPNSGRALQTLRRGKAEAAAGSAPPTSPVFTELEGEWSMVSGFMNGKPMDQMGVKYGVRSFHGNETRLMFGPDTYITATFTIDRRQVPHTIDYVHTQGIYAGKTQRGIYDCDGKTLKLSSSPPGQPRPTGFEERGANVVTVFTRRQ